MIETETILSIVLPILTIIAGIFGAKWKFGKSLISKITSLMNSIDDALEDDVITEDEAKLILKRIQSLLNK